MIEILVIIGFIVWYVGSLIISETIGKQRKMGEEWSFFIQRKMGEEWSFFISMIFSPVIGFLVTYFGKKETI